MEIANEGTHENPRRGNYTVRTLKGRSAQALDIRTTQRSGFVRDYPRLALHVWNLVARSLKAMDYSE